MTSFLTEWPQASKLLIQHRVASLIIWREREKKKLESWSEPLPPVLNLISRSSLIHFCICIYVWTWWPRSIQSKKKEASSQEWLSKGGGRRHSTFQAWSNCWLNFFYNYSIEERKQRLHFPLSFQQSSAGEMVTILGLGRDQEGMDFLVTPRVNTCWNQKDEDRIHIQHLRWEHDWRAWEEHKREGEGEGGGMK